MWIKRYAGVGTREKKVCMTHVRWSRHDGVFSEGWYCSELRIRLGDWTGGEEGDMKESLPFSLAEVQFYLMDYSQ